MVIQRSDRSATDLAATSMVELGLAELVRQVAQRLEEHEVFLGHGTANVWDEAAYLVLGVIKIKGLDLLHWDGVVPQLNVDVRAQQRVEEAVVKRIQQRIPTAYLTQTIPFAGWNFYVDDRVLIPRSPLAELILAGFAPWIDSGRIRRILDLGTGSGCIAISCAKILPKVQVDAVDIDAAALEVAEINRIRHRVTRRVQLWQSDLFDQLPPQQYEVIISNPPYVGRLEMQSLPPEYLHEPSQALMAGEDGDELVVRILDQAPKYLAPGGILVVEVGNSAPLIMERYPRLPLIWLEFMEGEGEVLLITREQLLAGG